MLACLALTFHAPTVTSSATSTPATTYYMFGRDAVTWLSDATAHPVVPYLASVPISLLSWFKYLVVVCHVANLTPVKLRSQLYGAIIHISPRLVDPLVYKMSLEGPGDASFAGIGGLGEQVCELREVCVFNVCILKVITSTH
jgi:hypothetical protein